MCLSVCLSLSYPLLSLYECVCVCVCIYIHVYMSACVLLHATFLITYTYALMITTDRSMTWLAAKRTTNLSTSMYRALMSMSFTCIRQHCWQGRVWLSRWRAASWDWWSRQRPVLWLRSVSPLCPAGNLLSLTSSLFPYCWLLASPWARLSREARKGSWIWQSTAKRLVTGSWYSHKD